MILYDIIIYFYIKISITLFFDGAFHNVKLANILTVKIYCTNIVTKEGYTFY